MRISVEDIYKMSTRQLRKEIRKLTLEANERIGEYRQSDTFSPQYENLIVRLKGIAGTRRGYKGEVGLGTSRKLKTELQSQLRGLRKFVELDEYSPKGIDEFNDKTERQYETFMDNYGYISREDYLEMVDTMNLVKASLKGWGYEDIMGTSGRAGISLGASMAKKYVEADSKGKGNFIHYVEQAKKLSTGGSTEDLFDTLTELMRADGVL